MLDNNCLSLPLVLENKNININHYMYHKLKCRLRGTMITNSSLPLMFENKMSISSIKMYRNWKCWLRGALITII